ncbi:MAG: CvpA family protein [Treponema sp.]|nr:CvpA family protein [Treponema sp.]
MSFPVIDIVFVSLIGLLMIRCYLKGFVSEILSMAGIVFGVLAALFLYKNAAEFLRANYWHDLKIIPEIISFAAIFIIVLIIVKILEKILTKIIDGISLSNVNGVLGIIFGFAEGVALVSLILFLLRLQPLFDSSVILSESFFARILLPFITGREDALNV